MKRKKKSMRQKNLDNPSSSLWRRKADTLWSQLVCARAKNQCEICRATKMVQAHHVIDRSWFPTRYELDNGVALCPSHHKYSRLCSAHKGTLLFHDWFRTMYTTRRDMLIGWAEDAVIVKKTRTGKQPKPDYKWEYGRLLKESSVKE